jgi:hypothetical protein
MTETQRMDLRRYQRASVCCPLTLCQGETMERFVATGLNEGGFMVLSHEPLAIGPQLHMIFELPDGNIIEADGEVCSSTPEVGFGVKFTNLDSQQRYSIARVVQEATSQPAAPTHHSSNQEQLAQWKKLRSEPRVSLSFEVQLESQDETGEAFVENGKASDVSRHGAGILTSRPYEVEQSVKIIGPGKKFTAPAVVRNCMREGRYWKIGLRLVSVPDEWVIR